MSVRCELIKHHMKLDDKDIDEYGIRFYDTSDRDATVRIVNDICPNRTSIDEFIILVNNCDISVIHIGDIIEDYLCT